MTTKFQLLKTRFDECDCYEYWANVEGEITGRSVVSSTDGERRLEVIVNEVEKPGKTKILLSRLFGKPMPKERRWKNRMWIYEKNVKQWNLEG